MLNNKARNKKRLNKPGNSALHYRFDSLECKVPVCLCPLFAHRLEETEVLITATVQKMQSTPNESEN